MAPGWRTAKFADWRLSLGQPASLLVLSLPSQQRATKRPRAGRLAFGWLEIWGKADLEHCLPLVMCLGQIWLEGHPANAPCRHFSIPINAKNNLWLGSPWKLICTRSRAWLCSRWDEIEVGWCADPSGTAMLGQHMLRLEQAPDPQPLAKIRLISWDQVDLVPDIKLIRTDTTLWS